MNSELLQLAIDIETALAKRHRGYTIRGEQMNWIVQLIRFHKQLEDNQKAKRVADASIVAP